MLDVNPRTRLEADRYRNALRGRANGLPTVSVVAVAGTDPEATVRETTSCYARWSHLGVELIVVCGDGETWEPAIAEIPDGIRVIYGPADATQSQLRSLGLASAIGDLVMLVDDPATARDEWLEHLRGAGRQTESPRA
jgi:hypothetical protein